MESGQHLSWLAFLMSFSRKLREKHFASRPVFSSRHPDCTYWSHRSIFVLRQAQDKRCVFFLFKSPPPPLQKGGNCLLLSVTRVMDNLE